MLKIARFNSAVSKVQAVLIIAVIIIAAVAVGYFYQSKVSPQQPTPSPSPSASPSITPSPAPSPIPAALKITNLFIDPIESWVNQPINVSVNVLNTGKQEINYSLPVSVDGKVVQSIQVELAPGESNTVVAAFNESNLGSYRATISGLGTTFRVVETGKHTLHVICGRSGFTFTLDGVPEVSPFVELVDVGVHTIVFPALEQIQISGWGLVKFSFGTWSDGSTALSKTSNV